MIKHLHLKKYSLSLLLGGLLLLFFIPQVFADTTAVAFDVNGYVGRWYIDGQPFMEGNQVVDLESGTYNFHLIAVENNYVQLTIDDAGNVIVSDTNLATGGVGEFRLTTHDINVNPSGYVGRWMSGADTIHEGWYIGEQTIHLPAATYRFGLVTVENDYFNYTVGTSGNVTVSDPILGTGGDHALTLTTLEINVNPSGYVGRWMPGADTFSTGWFSGEQIIHLPAATYRFGLAAVVNDYFNYTVDTAGNVTVSDPILATGGDHALTLITHEINVNPSGYVGRWMSGADTFSTGWYIGERTIHLPAATYRFGLAAVVSDYFNYTVDTAGNVTVSDPILATGGDHALTLTTHEINVNPSGYVGRWMSGADTFSTGWFFGEQTIHLPAATYRFGLAAVVSDYFNYTVDTAGNVTVSDPILATGGDHALTLITHEINVNPSGYAGRWMPGADTFSTGWFTGEQTIHLPATTYRFGLTAVDTTYFEYMVGTDGNVSGIAPHKAVFSANNLTLITRAIHFDVGGAPGVWTFGDTIPYFANNQTLCLPAMVDDFVMAGDSFEVTVANSAAPYLFTVSPPSANIHVDGTDYTVALSLAAENPGCYDIPKLAWADLDKAIAEAEIDLEQVREGLQAHGDAACVAYEAGNLVLSGKNLCAILTILQTEKGMAHIDPASAEDIRTTAVQVAAALGIPLPCLDR